MKLYPSKLKNSIYTLISLVLMTGGILFIIDGEWIGWYLTIFFGVCAIAIGINVLPGAAFLRVDEKGIAIKHMYKTHILAWSDIGIFFVHTGNKYELVGFSYSQEYKKHRKGRKISKILTGTEGVLPETYGFKAEELAELLNNEKMKYLQ